mmetsp:Transcript_16038/g.49625  ORF Transcript_16038/g.49625 Transcript_16038/m.49625 type:complete len:330 (-) Transcript_16038:41-1030(-)
MASWSEKEAKAVEALLAGLPAWGDRSTDASAPLPVGSKTTTGVLPESGLRYYWRPNAEPRDRVELVVAVRAGSIDEEDEERGLAHVLEHLAFRARADDAGARADALSYADFVYFMLAEEDKSTDAAMRYWFQCVDVDGDGVVDYRDAAYFYDVQARRMECLGHDVISFDDVLCQMSDLLGPESMRLPCCAGRAGELRLVLDDVMRKRDQAGVFFDALFSLDKFVAFEQRDPFADRLKRDDPFDCEWDRFAAAEYARLATEEDQAEEEAAAAAAARERGGAPYDDDSDDDPVMSPDGILSPELSPLDDGFGGDHVQIESSAKRRASEAPF